MNTFSQSQHLNAPDGDRVFITGCCLHLTGHITASEEAATSHTALFQKPMLLASKCLIFLWYVVLPEMFLTLESSEHLERREIYDRQTLTVQM